MLASSGTEFQHVEGAPPSTSGCQPAPNSTTYENQTEPLQGSSHNFEIDFNRPLAYATSSYSGYVNVSLRLWCPVQQCGPVGQLSNKVRLSNWQMTTATVEGIFVCPDKLFD